MSPLREDRRFWSLWLFLLLLLLIAAVSATGANDKDTSSGSLNRANGGAKPAAPQHPAKEGEQAEERKANTKGEDLASPQALGSAIRDVESNSAGKSAGAAPAPEGPVLAADGTAAATGASGDAAARSEKNGAAAAASEEGERQEPQDPMYSRGRALSAPFVRHYSKQMVILWEWYTKTTGATMNGKRKQDEDALLVHAPSHWQHNVRFKAIFDGHGGSAVSRTCVAQFCNIFGNMPDLSPESFKRTSLMLDAVIQADPVRHERGGSTGLIVAIERPDERVPKFKIHVSNIGDSRAFILHRNGNYTIMSKDHKPNDPQEVARISRAGGFVSRVRKVYRVDGTLSVSRAFGDIRMKSNASLPATEQKVVAIPDVRTFEAYEGDYIFMACDGMFEAPGMSWDYVANLLQRELQNTNDNLVETAFRMLNTAYLLGSADNISIVLTKLMSRKRNSSVVKRFTYDFSGRREFVETQLLLAPNVYRSGTYHTSAGPVVTLF
ncbi:protein phosphatase 2C, putative [Eimeria necatrix]|uniref:protein-serine/threonine phosphatase n=1 Tax=Eimeria necatrix TaxID=51315 RepID=U6MMQ5_9EIME|nr:protein phosphatase 2C, putative [Eimeria necatrix]CDJ63734.1 protein phosphatase 2C, putative [Eimeria necatrix]